MTWNFWGVRVPNQKVKSVGEVWMFSGAKYFGLGLKGRLFCHYVSRSLPCQGPRKTAAIYHTVM